MIDLVLGGAYGLMIIVSFCLGYRYGYKQGKETGTKIGVDSCADTAGWIINNYCCEQCIDNMRKRIFGRGKP